MVPVEEDWSGLQLAQEVERNLGRLSKEALWMSGEKRKLRRLGF